VTVGPFSMDREIRTCADCLAQRAVQHDSNCVETGRVRGAYDAGLVLPPTGVLPQHAAATAATVVHVLRQQTVAAAAGQCEPCEPDREAIEIHLPTLRITRAAVVPWDHCPVCSRSETGADPLAPIHGMLQAHVRHARAG
jgi:bacteriocin biosynthesis cyclodehydratase domain-containing protein